MIKRALILILFAHSAFAGWSGFPLEDQTSNWYQVREAYNPIGQLYSSIVERCEGVGIDPPEIVETWTVSDGWNGSELLTKQITTTNQIGSFQYVDSNFKVETAHPYLTRYFMQQLDTKMVELYTKYTPTNYFGPDGTLSNAFLISATDPEPGFTPFAANKGTWFLYTGVGYQSNLVTNGYGYVTNDDYIAEFTYESPRTNEWHYHEIHYARGTNGVAAWSNIYSGVTLYTEGHGLDLYDFSKYPVVRGYGSRPAGDVGISGSIVTPDGITNATETVTVSGGATNTPCTSVWFSVTNMTFDGAGMTNGDAFAVVWTNNFALYGSGLRPFRLHARDFDERQKIINKMTHAGCGFINDGISRIGLVYSYPGTGQTNQYQAVSGWSNTWGEAIAGVDEEYGPQGPADKRRPAFKAYSTGQWRLSLGNEEWLSSAIAVENEMIFTNLPAFSKTISLYVGVTNPEPSYEYTFDAFETAQPLPFGTWGVSWSDTFGSVSTASTPTYGQSATQPAPPDAPTSNITQRLRGYESYAPVGLINYAVENGFEYQ